MCVYIYIYTKCVLILGHVLYVDNNYDNSHKFDLMGLL